ncbi:MAG TPA: DUF6597 domain-containing transcriptional factor, partial [Gemmatirosa sp.]
MLRCRPAAHGIHSAGRPVSLEPDRDEPVRLSAAAPRAIAAAPRTFQAGSSSSHLASTPCASSTLPTARCAPYVDCLWSVERTFAAPADTFMLLPDRYVELVFSAGARFAVAPADSTDGPGSGAPPGPGQVLPRAYVVGLLDAPVRLRAHGTVRAVAVRCPAW